MSLHARIDDVRSPEDFDECRVAFSIWDGDDTATIAFSEDIGIPHVCYLIETQNRFVSDRAYNAYEQMLEYIYNTACDKIEIGKQFDTGE